MIKMNNEGYRVPLESQSDIQAMRSWFKNNKFDLRPRCQPSKAPVPVNVGNINAKNGDGEEEKFMIRVYEPQDGSRPEGILRPALIVYHGGGWVLGDPTADEGKQIPILVLCVPFPIPLQCITSVDVFYLVSL